MGIYVNGDYPDVMREKIDTKSELQGFPESRLPTFTAEESAEILGSHDFLGINFYTAGSSWLYVTPFGIRKQMTWIADQIGADVPIYITENGFSDLIGNLDDLHREYYYKHYINQL